MSLLGKIVGNIERVMPGGTAMLAGAGATALGMPPQVGMAIGNTAAQRYGAPSPGAAPMTVALPGLPALGGAVMRALPAVGAAVGMGARAAGAAARGAVTWCRRNPAWCANAGGTAAIAAMIENGTLPMPRRRRRKGISGRDLGAYRRVHNLLAGFCSPKAKIRKAC